MIYLNNLSLLIMSGNTFGTLFKITNFGESHGSAIGVVIDGCPSGIEIDELFIQKEMDRRRPGQSELTTSRKEDDKVEIISGVFKSKSTGAPICLMIKNLDQNSKDYSHLENTFRPSHADFTYDKKYGNRDYRGGGRASARETATRVAAGAIAKLLLKNINITIHAGVTQVGELKYVPGDKGYNWTEVECNPVRCPDKIYSEKMQKLILKAKDEGDTLGGIVSCEILNCPVGLGEPVFDKLHADLAKAMLSINAVKGFEYGSGFSSVKMKGSEHNDIWIESNGTFKTTTNFSGGIQGGISNGMPINFNVAFKPVATIMKDQKGVDKSGNKIIIEGKGRHDPCVVTRAVPIVEAMAAIVLADHYLRSKTNKITDLE